MWLECLIVRDAHAAAAEGDGRGQPAAGGWGWQVVGADGAAGHFARIRVLVGQEAVAVEGHVWGGGAREVCGSENLQVQACAAALCSLVYICFPTNAAVSHSSACASIILNKVHQCV
jgi:hypothetical protein